MPGGRAARRRKPPAIHPPAKPGKTPQSPARRRQPVAPPLRRWPTTSRPLPQAGQPRRSMPARSTRVHRLARPGRPSRPLPTHPRSLPADLPATLHRRGLRRCPTPQPKPVPPYNPAQPRNRAPAHKPGLLLKAAPAFKSVPLTPRPLPAPPPKRRLLYRIRKPSCHPLDRRMLHRPDLRIFPKPRSPCRRRRQALRSLLRHPLPAGQHRRRATQALPQAQRHRQAKRRVRRPAAPAHRTRRQLQAPTSRKAAASKTHQRRRPTPILRRRPRIRLPIPILRKPARMRQLTPPPSQPALAPRQRPCSLICRLRRRPGPRPHRRNSTL